MRSIRRILTSPAPEDESDSGSETKGPKSPNLVSSILHSFRKTPSPGLTTTMSRSVSRKSTFRSSQDLDSVSLQTPVPVGPVKFMVNDDDDAEDNEDQVDNEDDTDDIMTPRDFLDVGQFEQSERRLSHTYASSIIGGSSIVHDDDKDEVPAEHAHVEEKSPEGAEEHKIFSFAMPFGGNISSGLQLPSLKLPFSDDEHQAQKDEIRAKLERQESISSIEEKLLFKDFKFGDPSRFDAIKRAVIPMSLRHEIKHLLTDADRPRYETIYDEIAGDVLILGGYRGSILRDKKTGRRVWVPVMKAGLNLKKINLVVGPTDEDELKAHETVYADGVLSHVGPIDICRRLMKKLDNGKVNLHDFGYDWRLSCDLNGEKLHAKLKAINEANGGKGVLVIAHSMGGLVAHYAMQKGPSLFRGLVYVGVPFECPNVLGPIRWGDNVLFSTKVLTAEANFFFRSSFVFLPEDGRIFTDKQTGKRIDLNFYDPDVWVEYNLSPLVSQKRKDIIERARQESKKSSDHLNSLDEEVYHATWEESYDYLKRTLARTRKFHEFLKHDPVKKYPPLALVYSYSVPSVRESLVDGVKKLKEGDFFHFVYGPGDGVIHHKWLMPEPYGFQLVGKHASHYGHVSLMSDLKTMGQALISIVDAEKN